MISDLPRGLQEHAYECAAREYLRKLPLEHFMEATAQATQRKITLASLSLVEARRADFHLFNELLVQYPRRDRRKLGQIVPDNMVVLTDQPLHPEGAYNVPLEPAGPYWTMEYVSKGSKRKDYERSFRKYERELKVPYYLVFYPDIQELTLFRHNQEKYISVQPNTQGRYALPELEIEVGLVDGWVRYWHRGELLPLPADLERDLVEARRKLAEQGRQLEQEKQRAEQEKQRAEQEKQRADALQERLAAMERRLAELQARGGQV